LSAGCDVFAMDDDGNMAVDIFFKNCIVGCIVNMEAVDILLDRMVGRLRDGKEAVIIDIKKAKPQILYRCQFC
jgi:hypothetical protein